MEKRNNYNLFTERCAKREELGDKIVSGAEVVIRFVRANWRPALKMVINGLSRVLTFENMLEFCEDFYGDECADSVQKNCGQEISKDAYENIRAFLGDPIANNYADSVRAGEVTPEAAENLGRMLWADHYRSAGRREIDEVRWNDAEDGWRPDDI